jgi:pimeloyl-ACP methyl ester carboxylesterase
MKIAAIPIILIFAVAELLLTACHSNSTGVDAHTVEAQYAARGSHETSRKRVPGFVIHYPRDMIGDHPIITWGNGTGANPSDYARLLDHLASWGFVVIASECPNTGTGVEMIEGVELLVERDRNPDSVFYGMLDTRRIGAAGHSQGGIGTVAAAADPRVVSSAPLAGAGYTGNVKGPLLLVAGARDITVPPITLRGSYQYAPVPTFFITAKDMNHASFTDDGGSCRGYLTAWFRFQLRNDDEAARAFIAGCEICGHDNWQVEKKQFP